MIKRKFIIVTLVLIIVVSVISVFVIRKTNNDSEVNDCFTVTFIDYNGTILKEERNVELGSSVNPPSVPLRDGYTFVGWDKEFDNISENIIVTAIYEKKNKPTFIVSSIDIESGTRNIKVTIEVVNNPNISSIGLTVIFDKKLTLTNVIYNDKIGGYSLPPEKMNSPIKLIWLSPLKEVKGDFVFVTLEFSVEADASGQLPITITYVPDDIYGMNEENIYFDIINGLVNIK